MKYENIKNFINGTDGNGCKLVTTESEFVKLCLQQKPDLIYLRIKCKCGKEFKKTFDKFKIGNQRQCRYCGRKKTKNKLSKSFIEIKTFLTNKGYTVITSEKEFNETKEKSKKTPTKTPLAFNDSDGYLYFTSINHIQEGHLPTCFGFHNPFTIQNIRLWCKINKKPYKLISNTYKNAFQKLEWKCLKDTCGEIFKAPWADIEHGTGCSYCAGKQVGKNNCLAMCCAELVKEWNTDKNINVTPYDVTTGTHKKVWWKCSECGYEWIASINNRVKGRGCPRCKQSKGEKKIREWLSKNSIKFIQEYDQFPNLLSKNGNPLRFDFYLPDYNYCIEYDGEFHYKKLYDEQNFETQKYNDMLKNRYCKRYKIYLLRIPYWNFNDIETILDKNLRRQYINGIYKSKTRKDLS